jgi:hypothetical protein
LALVLYMLAASPGLSHARIIRVPSELGTLQSAIDAADAGDEVLVAPGTYRGAGNKNLDLHQMDITVRSEGGAEVTVIDCEGSGRGFVLYGGFTRSAVIEGFTIVNGNGSDEGVGGGGMVIGGGSPTIRNCVFRNNRAISSVFAGGGGGGIACHGSSAMIEGCVFIQNTVDIAPGAVGGGLASHESTPFIRGCEFIDNVAVGSGGGGGGVYVHLIAPHPGVTIENCDFIRNHANTGGGGVVTGSMIIDCVIDGNTAGGAAGMGVLFSEITRCTIRGNVSGLLGGGVELGGSRMIDCVITNNTAIQGGGVAAVGGSGSTIEDCLITDNVAEVGGGLFCSSREPTVVQGCTFARNRAPEASGLAFYALERISHQVDNTIVTHGFGGPAIECLGIASVNLTCTDLFGNEGGDWTGCIAGQVGTLGNFSADPRLCSSDKENFTLAANSPCLPGNHPQGTNCGIIGAEGQGCPAVAVEATTWGRIKARYRE